MARSAGRLSRAVNKLIADGSMTKQAAFAVYGKQTKTQPGTVVRELLPGRPSSGHCEAPQTPCSGYVWRV